MSHSESMKVATEQLRIWMFLLYFNLHKMFFTPYPSCLFYNYGKTGAILEPLGPGVEFTVQNDQQIYQEVTKKILGHLNWTWLNKSWFGIMHTFTKQPAHGRGFMFEGYLWIDWTKWTLHTPTVCVLSLLYTLYYKHILFIFA